MPRFNNSYFSSINSMCIKKKCSSAKLRLGNHKKKSVTLDKFIQACKHENSAAQRVLKLSDTLVYPLLSNKGDNIPFNIFGFPQKRHCCWKASGRDKLWEDGPRVAIVGAGIAGLSAASHLANNGFTNFHIYEASSRLGGRINTSKFSSGGSCELGAEWLTGGNFSNSLVLMAAQEGLLTRVDRKYNRQVVCLTSEGRALCSSMCAQGRKIFNKIRKEAYRLYNIASEFKHGTLSYFLDQRIGQELDGFEEDSKESLRRQMFAFKNDLRTRWGAELGKMSSDLLGQCTEEPQDAVRLQEGLVNAMLPLLREIPQSKIHLSSPVKTIFWGPHKTSVLLDEGQEVPCDFIIITVPLGYLKQNHETLFHPKLPEDKVEAIERIGFGNLTKIFLKYDSEIWGDRRTEISTLWKSRDWCDRGSYWYKGISSVEVKGDMAGVTVAGAESVYAEEETAEIVAHDLTSLLRCFTGSSIIPHPQELIKSRWNTDTWYGGAGTYMSLETLGDDPATLGKPVALPDKISPTLLFAGEATSTDRMNTAHGARATGIREAQRILEHTAPPPPPHECV